MKRFIIKTSVVIFGALILPCIILNYITDSSYIDSLELLKHYQLKKIKKLTNEKIYFFGDSSCGNAIDHGSYGPNVLNLSLTGSYNIKGSYEMLKLAKEQCPDMNTVVIMHSIDVFRRDDDPFRKVGDSTEVRNIPLYSKIKMLRAKIRAKLFSLDFDFTDIFDSAKTHIENDYLKQSDEKAKAEPYFIHNSLSQHNRDSIMRIAEYCVEKDISYIFVIGPSTLIEENSEFWSLKSFFTAHNVNFMEDYYLLDTTNIGDSQDHVAPLFKSDSTLYYRRLIKTYFLDQADE